MIEGTIYEHCISVSAFSAPLLPFLPNVIGGPDIWEENKTISKSIEIRGGVIKNPKIISFQNREKEYPHKFR